jgi:glycosyltransferase involved in cell wall biosynthesis
MGTYALGLFTNMYPRFEGDYRGIFIQRMVKDLESQGILVKKAVKTSASVTGYIPFYCKSVLLAKDPHLDIMQAEYIPHSCIVPTLLRRKTCPLVLKFHGDDARIFPFKNSFFMSLTQAMIKRADYVLTSSEEIRSTLISIGAHPENISAVHTGVDTNFFRPAPKAPLRKDTGLPPDVTIFLFIGRLHPWKGINELISVADMCREFRFVFIGPGTIPPHPENCMFLGSKSPEDVRMWYNISDCLVLPSYTEGFPTVIMEAFASGIPAITTNVGGCLELVEPEKTGLLVPARDVQALHTAVQWMGTHVEERTRMGIAARTMAEERFNHIRMIQRLIGIHESLIRK